MNSKTIAMTSRRVKEKNPKCPSAVCGQPRPRMDEMGSQKGLSWSRSAELRLRGNILWTCMDKSIVYCTRWYGLIY